MACGKQEVKSPLSREVQGSLCAILKIVPKSFKLVTAEEVMTGTGAREKLLRSAVSNGLMPKPPSFISLC
jgi:hypothetical protein